MVAVGVGFEPRGNGSAREKYEGELESEGRGGGVAERDSC